MNNPHATCGTCGSAIKPRDQFCLMCGAALAVQTTPDLSAHDAEVARPVAAPKAAVPASRFEDPALESVRTAPARPPAAVRGPASWSSPADQTQATAPPPVSGRDRVPGTTEPQPPIQQAEASAPARPRWTGMAIAIASVVLVAVLVVAGVMYRRVYSFNARIDKALAENQLFSPPGSCVADIYAAKKASSPNSSDLASAATKIREKLTPIGEEALRKWYVDSEGVDWDHTEKVYGFLQEVAPDDPAIKVRHDYVNAQIKLQNRDYATALTLYQQALSGDPKFVLALNGIAKVYIQDGSPLKNEQLALDYYNRVIQTDPSFTWAYKNISEYYMRKEDWPNAEAYMVRALGTSPQRPSILRALARIYFNMNRLPEALDYNQRYVMVAKDPDGIAKAQAAITQIRQKLAR